MRQRELQRRRAQRHAVRVAHRLDPLGALDPGRRGRGIVEARHRSAARAGGQQAGVEGAADRDANTALVAQRQQGGQRTVVEQAVAPGQHQRVDLGLAQHVEHDGHVVDAEADGADQAFALHRVKNGQRFVDHLAAHRVGRSAVRRRVAVVHEEQVHARQAQPLQAVLEAAANTAGAEVPALRERQHVDITVLRARCGSIGLKQPTDLRRQEQARVRTLAQRIAEAPLRQAVAVVRCRVEAAAAAGPGGLQHRPCIALGNALEQVAQRRAAQAKAGATAGAGRKQRASHARVCTGEQPPCYD